MDCCCGDRGRLARGDAVKNIIGEVIGISIAACVASLIVTVLVVAIAYGLSLVGKLLEGII